MSSRFSRLEFGSKQLDDASDVALLGEPAAAHGGLQKKAGEGELVRSAEHYHTGADNAARCGRFEQALQLYTRVLREDRARVAAWVGQVQMLVELGEHTEARLWSDKALELFRKNGELLAAKSRACVRQGDRAAAKICSDEALQAPGSSPARWIARGEVLLDAGEVRARDCFDKAMAEAGADWHERLVVARIYLYHRKPTPALEFAMLAVERAPAEVFAWLVQAQCFDALGNSARAVESCKRALELDPRSQDAREMRASLSSSGFGSRFARRLKGWITG